MYIKYISTLLVFLLPFCTIAQEEEHDNPQERANWERSVVQDPKTGSVPRQELENARTSMNNWFKAVKQSRTSVAIPNIKWTERGPNNVGGFTRALLWDPNNGTTKKKVWAGGAGGGLWYNNDITNANSSWTKVDDLWDNIGISWIAVHPKNPKIMYVSTGVREQTGGYDGLNAAGGGIWKSTNSGTSWERLPSTIPNYVKSDTITAKWRNIYKVIVTNQGNVLALTRGGIFQSKDGGTSWNLLTGTNAPTTVNESVSDMEMGKDGILYIAEGTSAASPRILKSTDSTITNFTVCKLPKETYENGRVEIALARSTEGDKQVIYAVSADETNPTYHFFLKSTDGGSSWTDMTPATYMEDNKAVPFFNKQGFHDLILGTHDSKPDVLFVGGVGFNITTNGGQKWIKEVNESGWFTPHTVMHADHQAFACNPNNPDEALFGNDGGVYYSANWSTETDSLKNLKIQARNKGYNVTQYYAVDLNPVKNSGTVAGGTQDNGTHAITAAYNTVGTGVEINGGDGAFTFIDKIDTNIVISSYTHISPRLHKRGAAKNFFREEMEPQMSNKGQFINPAEYDSPNHTYYANYTFGSQSADDENLAVRYKISKSNDSTVLYTYKASYIKCKGASEIKVSSMKLGKTPGVLYVGTRNGDVYKANDIPLDGDATVTLTKIMSGDSTAIGNVSCIDFGKDENTIVVTKSNYNVKSVFWTTDAGKTWISKDETTHGLPNIPIRYAFINPKDTKQVMLATELGVWSTIDITAANPDWKPNNQTLANVRCDMLKYRESDETVIVGTHGRGIFSTQINQPTCANAVAGANPTICNNTTASLTATCELGVVKWFDAAGIKELATGSPFVTPALTANTAYKVRCENAGCPVAFTDVSVTVNPVLEAPIAEAVTIKISTSTQLTATCTNGKPTWYDVETGGKPLGSGTFTTPELSANTAYYVACETGGTPNCVSSRTHQPVRVKLEMVNSVVPVSPNKATPTDTQSDKIVIDKAGVNVLKGEKIDGVVLEVFPNPSAGLCHWRLYLDEAHEAQLKLVSTIGNEHLNLNLNTPSQVHEGTIDLTNLTTGVYYLAFKIGEKNIAQKIIKN